MRDISKAKIEGEALFAIKVSAAVVCNFLIAMVAVAQPTSNAGEPTPMTGPAPKPTFESKLPKCQGDNPRGWSGCTGNFRFPNGNFYSGEWRNGNRDGVGILRIVSGGPTQNNNIGTKTPSIYFGQFHNGRLNGHGIWVLDNGVWYEGVFDANIYVRSSTQRPAELISDSEKFKIKCESFGLKYGSGDYAQCMLAQEKMANEAFENSAKREILNREAERRANAESTNSAINAFKAMGEISKPQWLSNPNCPSVLNARPGQYPGCN